jgi:hypothetical protein
LGVGQVHDGLGLMALALHASLKRTPAPAAVGAKAYVFGWVF